MIATMALFLALGLDTLAVALSLGLSGLPRARWLRVGLTFAVFEGVMPVIGLAIGYRLSDILGTVAAYIAAGALIVIGILALREALWEDDDEESLLSKERPLVLTGLLVSLDELAVGFSLGVLKAAPGLALGYIAVQALALTFLGLSLGQRLGVRLESRAELASGIVLMILGIALLISEATGRHFL